jgi:CRISPR type III-B/RAMP module-associated protein Cmr5
MTARRIDQGMAAIAADMLPDTVSRDLRGRYRRLPAILHRSGLAATYAFVASKAQDRGLGPAYTQVARGIRERLRTRHLVDLAPDASHADVLRSLGNLTVTEYARATREITMLFGWLSRLADATVSREPAPTDDSADGAGTVRGGHAVGDTP